MRLLAVCAALLAWSAAAHARAGLVELDLLCPGTEVARDAQGGLTGVTVARGTEHGVVEGARGELYGPARSAAAAALARVEVASADAGSSRLRLVDGTQERLEGIGPGAYVQLRALLPADLHRGEVLWLWLGDVEFTDLRQHPFVTPAELLAARGRAVEDRVLAAMVADCRKLVGLVKRLDHRIARGRWKGRQVWEVFAEAGPDDLRAFLRWAREFPAAWVGARKRLGRAYAKWLVHDAPPASIDVGAELASHPTDEALAAAAKLVFPLGIETYLVTVMDGVCRDPEAFSPQAETVRQVERLVRVADEVGPYHRALVAGARGCVEGRDAQAVDRAVTAFAAASKHFVEAGRFVPALVSRTHVVRFLRSAELFDAARAEIGAARAFGARLVHAERSPKRVAELRSRLAVLAWYEAILDRVAGRHRRVVETLGPLVRTFTDAGFRGDRSRQLGLLGELARAHRKLGALAEAEAVYGRMERIAGELQDTSQLAAVALDRGRLHWQRARWADALADYERAAARARRAVDPLSESRALAAAGQALWSLGRNAEALERHEQGMAVARAHGDRKHVAWQLVQVARIRTAAGDRPAGRALLEQALGLHREDGRPASEAEVLHELGDLELALSRHAAAEARYAESLAVARRASLAPQESSALRGLAQSHHRRRDDAGAVALQREAVTVLERTGDAAALGQTLYWLAIYLTGTGARGEAREALGRLRATEAADPALRAWGALGLAGLARHDGKLDEALHLARLAERESGPGAPVEQRLAVLSALSSAHLVRAEYAASLEVAERQIALARASGNRPALVDALRAQATALLDLGRLAEASAALDAALPIADANADPAQRAWLLCRLAEAAGQRGDWAEQRRLYAEAAQQAKEAGDRYGEAAFLFGDALVLVRLRDLEGALAGMDAAERRAGEVISAGFAVRLGAVRGETLALLGRRDEAEATLRATLGRARESDPAVVPEVLATLGRVLADAKRFDGPGRGLRAGRATGGRAPLGGALPARAHPGGRRRRRGRPGEPPSVPGADRARLRRPGRRRGARPLPRRQARRLPPAREAPAARGGDRRGARGPGASQAGRAGGGRRARGQPGGRGGRARRRARGPGGPAPGGARRRARPRGARHGQAGAA